MAKIHVHDLAKEYGMTSKEMLEQLHELKIPAKTASSSIDSAYESIIRTKLKPIAEAHAKEIEAQKQAEEEKARAEAEAIRQAEEQKRLEAEERRQKERALKEEQDRIEAEARAKAEAEAKAKAEAEAKAKAEAEEKARLEAEANRGDNAPTSKPSLTSLLDQIAQQEEVLKANKSAEQAEEKPKTQQKKRSPKSENDNEKGERKGRGKKDDSKKSKDSKDAAKKERRPKKKETAEERKARLAQEAEDLTREEILAEARAAVEQATQASEGRRQKRKERRMKQQQEEERQQQIQQALKNDQDLSELDTVKVPQGSTVGDLADLLGVAANDIIKRLFLLGTPLTLTESLSDELIELVADDLGADIKIMTPEEEQSFSFYDDPKDLLPRAPVVTVMGHVDHGKTSLLDAIRDTGVAAGEAGGITQAIGASQVHINGKTITFVDTPGHETFTAMRARGAKVTDIVILVVAADDGVMPQTIESINHAKAAGVPIVVAVNKCDRDDANPERVRTELSEYGVIPEDWGGENMFVNISARQRMGIEELLESVLLQAEVLELKANPNTFASGFVLEAKLDQGRGSVATLLVNRGKLHVGDTIVAGLAYGRVRAMLDQHGNNVTEAGPSDPVEVLGLNSVPAAGDEFRVFEDEREARTLADERALKARIERQNRVKHVTLENLFETIEDSEFKELNLIIKADVHGSIEALEDSLSKMDQSEVRINVIHSAVGAITETDVTLAAASNAIIIGFGVRPEASARNKAEHEGVQIKCYSVIYKLIEDIDAARIGMLQPTEEEQTTGVAEVRDTFKVPKVGIAAGCMVVEGEISRNDNVRLIRDGIVIYNGTFASMRRFKDDVKSVRAGYECGLGLENYQDVKPGDIMECYKIVEVARTE